MKFSGKLIIFWLTVLALVFILPLDAKTQDYIVFSSFQVKPNLLGDMPPFTIPAPAFEVTFQVAYGMNPGDTALGINEDSIKFYLVDSTPPYPRDTIYLGSNYGGDGLWPGFIMTKDSTITDSGIIFDKFTFTWDSLNPAGALHSGKYSYYFRGIYDFITSEGETIPKVVAASRGSFYVGTLPSQSAKIITVITPTISSTVPPKPLFELKFRPRSTLVPYGEDVPDDSLRFVIHKPGGDSVVVFDGSQTPKLLTGFRMDKQKFGNETSPGADSVDFYFTWDTTNLVASSLANGAYQCAAHGVYEFSFPGAPPLGVSKDTSANFTVSASLPVPQESLVSVLVEPVTPLPGLTSSRPSFKAAFRVNSLVAKNGVGVPDSTLRFAIFDSTGNSIVVFRGDSLAGGFQMSKQGYDTAFPGADSMDVSFGWGLADPLADGKYYCKIQGTYNAGWILYAEDSVSFRVFGAPPQIAVLNVAGGYVNSKGEFDFFLRSFGASFGNFLDTTRFAIDFYFVNLPNTESEERSCIKTLLNDSTLHQIKFGSAEVETIKVQPDLSLLDGVGLDVFFYDGTTPDRAAYADSADQTTAYPEYLTCKDKLGNRSGIVFERFAVDGIAPQVTMLDSTDKAWRFYVCDVGSGVNDNSVVVKVDGTKVTSNNIVQYDSATNILTYYPMNLGALLSITATDKVGNRGNYSTYVKSGKLIIRDVHSFPNPFNPIKGEEAKIVFRSNRGDNPDAEMSAEIYDLAGKHIATLEQNSGGELTWDGRTNSGELVANGAYFCYVKIKDLQDLKIENYLLKIAVVKKD